MNNTRQKIYRGVNDKTYTFFELAKIRAEKRKRAMFYRGFESNRGPKSTAR